MYKIPTAFLGPHHGLGKKQGGDGHWEHFNMSSLPSFDVLTAVRLWAKTC